MRWLFRSVEGPPGGRAPTLVVVGANMSAPMVSFLGGPWTEDGSIAELTHGWFGDGHGGSSYCIGLSLSWLLSATSCLGSIAIVVLKMAGDKCMVNSRGKPGTDF